MVPRSWNNPSSSSLRRTHPRRIRPIVQMGGHIGLTDLPKHFVTLAAGRQTLCLRAPRSLRN
jgi:hypothetical protein